MSTPTYVERINELLRPSPPTGRSALDLFAGCGGLSRGFEAAGFSTYGFEWKEAAAQTYRTNLMGPCEQLFLKPGQSYPAVDVLIGGPPC